MQLIFFLAFGVLLGNSSAANVNVSEKVVTTTNTSLRLLDLIQIYIIKYRNQCLCKDLEKVNECYEGHIEAFASFTGPAKCSGETVITTFRAHIELLKQWSKCSSSTILSSGATSIIHGLSFLYKLGENAMVFLTENGKATPQLIATYRNIVTKSYRQIGVLYRVINESLLGLQKLFAEILRQFLNRRGKCEHINFKGIMNVGRLLAIRVALIIEVALEGCDCTKFANAVYEALAVISLLTYDIIMAILAVLTSMASVIIKETGSIPSELNSFLTVLNTFILGVHETIISLKTCDSEDAKSLLQGFFVQLSSLIENMPSCLGPVQPVGISVADVTKHLLKAYRKRLF